jgi:predicted protein tyrosine phosphatase
MADASPWQPNLSWITDNLAVGGSFPPQRGEDLARRHGVRAIVDLRGESKDDEAQLARHGMAFLHLPTEDHCAPCAVSIRRGVEFVTDALARDLKVLIHCEHGIGRSATLALCALAEQGWEPMAALALAKDRRALISPSPAQYECWAAWLSDVRARRGFAWDVPSFDEFKAIAYRHLPAANL